MNRPSSTYRPTASNATHIGTFLRFAFAGKEKDSETGLSYFGARYYDADLTTGWLSVDPMADKYPSMSPYNYCAGNPVKLVDPEGEEIYYKENGVLYTYKSIGNKYGFYSEGGELYAGKNGEFVNHLTDALSLLRIGIFGKSMVDFFLNSKNDIEIAQSDEGNGYDYKRKIVLLDIKHTSHIPIGTSIRDEKQVEPSTLFVSLGHEMAHAKHHIIFGDQYLTWPRIRKEWYAVGAENLIRREHFMNQRTYYPVIYSNIGMMPDYNSLPMPTYQRVFLPISSDKTSLLTFFNF